jgi:predicted neuraminidase
MFEPERDAPAGFLYWKRMQNPAITRPRTQLAIVLGCVLLVVLVASVEALRWQRAGSVASTPGMNTAPPGRVTLTELSHAHIPAPQGMPSAHASTLTPLPGNRLLAFWWAGSRESGPDVKVFASTWANGAWSAPSMVASRASLGAELGFGVRRIGNPVAWTDRAGRIHLYVVATGLGGWAAARIAHLVSQDHGKNFHVRRILPTSPLFNTSALVRTAPLALSDGGWWLPVYFEIGNKYPMLMAFDGQGNPTMLARIGNSTSTLQPAIVAVSATEVRAVMRDDSAQQLVQHASSVDGGATWQDLPALDLPNHSTSVAAIRLTSGQFLMLHNHVEGSASARSTLRLSISSDMRTWRTIADIAKGPAGDEFSYPSMQQVGNELHVTYTWQRQAIAHHRYRIHAEGTS